MAFSLRKFIKGFIIDKLTTESLHAQEGAVHVSDADNKLKIYLDSAQRSVVTEDQTQTLSGKSIDADTNTISNLEVDNLKSGVLDTDLTSVSASDDTIPSAKATKDYVDAQVAGNDEASEISYNNTTSGLTAADVQAAIDEVEARVDANDAKVSADGSVTSHSDVTDAGSGAIITAGERTQISTNQTDIANHLSDTTDAHDASAISYVNTTSGMTATDAQAAIDEVEGRVDTLEAATHVNTFEGRSGAVVSQSGDYDASEIDYTPSTLGDWNSSTDPGQTDDALDQLASRTKTLEDAPGGPGGRVSNYLANLAGGYDAEENDVSDWTESNNGVFDVSIESTNQLRGTYSYKLTATSATGGETIDTPSFTLDTPDFTSVMTFVCDLQTDSNYADDDIEVQIVQGSTIIKSLSDLGLIKAGRPKVVCQFQTLPSSEGTDVKVRFLTGAGTHEIVVDNIEFKNQDFLVGGSNSITDVRIEGLENAAGGTVPSNSLTICRGTSLTDSLGEYDASTGVFTAKRSGKLKVTVRCLWSNNSWSAGQYTYIAIYKNNISYSFIARYDVTAAITSFIGTEGSDSVKVEAGDTIDIRLFQNSGTALTPFASKNSSITFESMPSESNSSSLGGEVLSNVEYKGNANTTLTANTTDIDWAIIERDTLGEWDGSGFTAKTKKTIDVSGTVFLTASSATSVDLYIDGTLDRIVNIATGSDTKRPFSAKIKLEAGQRASFRVGSSVTLSNNASVHRIYISELPETSNGIVSEQVKVLIKLNSTTAASFSNGNYQAYENVDPLSTHPSWVNGTGDTITIDKTGKYRLIPNLLLQSHVAGGDSEYAALRAEIDSVVGEYIGLHRAKSTNNSAGNIAPMGSVLYLEKGQVLKLYIEENLTPAITTGASADLNYFILEEV